jgi:hypothetical protein
VRRSHLPMKAARHMRGPSFYYTTRRFQNFASFTLTFRPLHFVPSAFVPLSNALLTLWLTVH